MPVTRITCPACTAGLISANPLPPGKSIRCPRCSAAFPVPRKQDPDNPPSARTVTQLAAASRTGKTRVLPTPQPVTDRERVELPRISHFVCAGCAASISSNVPLPIGKQVKCPRCATLFPVTNPPPGRRAPTRLVPPRARPTVLAPTSPSPQRPRTQLAGGGAQRPATKLLPGAAHPDRPVSRIVCPLCAAVLKATGELHPRRVVLCPGCHRPFPLPSAPAPATMLVRRPARPRTQLAPPGPKEPAMPTPPRVAPKRPQGRRAPPPLPPPPRRQATRLLFVALAVLWMGLLGLAAYLVMSRFVNRELRAADWIVFSPDGRCKVEMPGMPKRQTAVAHGPGLIGAQTFVRDEGNQVFTVSFSDRSEEAMKEAGFDGFYTAERNYVLRKVEGTLTQETDVSQDGQAGREFRVEPRKGGIVVARVYLVPGSGPGRLYIVMFGGERWPPDGGDAATFLDSFTINPNTPVAAN